MRAQQVIALLFLIYAVGYAFCICVRAWRERALIKKEPGRFWQISLGETAVYFLTTMGFPDFILNTLLLRRCGWVEDNRLPGTLVAASVLPGALIACIYLWGGNTLHLPTLLLSMAAIAAGSTTGARIVNALNGKTIRRIMGIAILFSMGALILKILLSSGVSGTISVLTPLQLCAVLPLMFGFGLINMFGIPMKPPTIALFLLLGLSPIDTLALTMAIGVTSPIAGGIQVLRSGNYQQKIVLAGTFFGLIGAALGAVFTVTLSAAVLNLILLAIMALAAVSMLVPQDGNKNKTNPAQQKRNCK